MKTSLLFLVVFFLGGFNAVDSVCNEAVCASVVSKCMLTQSCKCDMTHCSCCKDCISCLSYLYDQCCSCVDMCPGVTGAVAALSRQSYTEEIPGGIPQLYAALTSEPDTQKRWRLMSFPVEVSDLSLQSVEDDAVNLVNCTVAYMSQCMPFKKCKAGCESMGASSFRWFRDGCCECIGESCKNFGLDESRCLACGEGGNKNEDEESLAEDDLDYGEDMEPQNAEAYS